MKSNKGSQKGGILMLTALVAMLCVPIGIGFAMHTNEPAVSLHADASVK